MGAGTAFEAQPPSGKPKAQDLGKNSDPRGSVWHRWDPHLHGPGTLRNDQFGGSDPWEEYLAAIEASDPPIRALGITDYYSLNVYEEVIKKKEARRLPKVELIFPNIEMRFGIGTGTNSPVNFHLLVSPNDPNHVEEIKRFLKSLTFGAHLDTFRCEASDLIRLGRIHNPNLTDDKAAEKEGANQFKVNFDQLRSELKQNIWAQENVLIAIASGSGDGTAGLQKDASLVTLRQEIERVAHIVFDSNPKARTFWLGQGVKTLDELTKAFGGPKPCLHGCDAHSAEAIISADRSRLCWIKGDLVFETLRQVCIEPETRIAIAPEAPLDALPSQIIDRIKVTNAPWLRTPELPLNAGLVGIIGARGSGKTALADIIAAGASALSASISDRSFLRRAAPYLSDCHAELTWNDGTTSNAALADDDYVDDEFFIPRVRYLSQQFVDTLCLAEGITDELLDEIERVIYQAQPPESRMGTTTFRELLNLRAERGRAKRRRNEEALLIAGRELNLERERKASLRKLQSERAEKFGAIEKDRQDRAKLLNKGSKERTQQLDHVSAVAEQIRIKVEQARRQRRALQSLKDEVDDTRSTDAPYRLRQMRETYEETGISDDRWAAFLLRFSGDVDQVISAAAKLIDKSISDLLGPEQLPVGSNNEPLLTTSLLPPDKSLNSLSLNLLDREITRLRKLIGIDTENAKLFQRLSEKISRDEAALAKLDRAIETAQKADSKIKELLELRKKSYAAVFEGIIDEEKELDGLYEVLKQRLKEEPGALGKLNFAVHRVVDLAAWAKQGEDLLDLRTNGPFKGKGSLLHAAQRELKLPWETGTSEEVSEAMARFREAHERGIVEHAPCNRSDQEAYRAWAERVSAWLYGTKHIKVTYGIQYEGVDIEQLSPGTRGIVLLLLYLAIDLDDDRPLVIDQPEENLDPKSINDELVERFRKAKHRRQIIIVTHNANLVVYADADQVIVARCGQHRPGELPEISYTCGSLENGDIRRQVCDILEGGEKAFKERAKRLRIKL